MPGRGDVLGWYNRLELIMRWWMVPAYANEGSLRFQPIKVWLYFNGPGPHVTRSSRGKGRGVILMECKPRWDFVGDHIYLAHQKISSYLPLWLWDGNPKPLELWFTSFPDRKLQSTHQSCWAFQNVILDFQMVLCLTSPVTRLRKHADNDSGNLAE